MYTTYVFGRHRGLGTTVHAVTLRGGLNTIPSPDAVRKLFDLTCSHGGFVKVVTQRAPTNGSRGPASLRDA